MFDPRRLLRHVDKLLANDPDDADIRRAVSAMYYALFHLLTSRAAKLVAGADNPGLQAQMRRGAEHREIRQVCDAFTKAAPRAPSGLEGILTAPIAPELVVIMRSFALLQDARVSADYDLEHQPSLMHAEAYRKSVHNAFDDFARIEDHPNTRAFLVLLLLDRKRRRG